MNLSPNTLDIARVAVPAAATILGIVMTHLFTRENVKRDLNNKALQNRYHKVYAPMRQALLGVHIARFSSGEKPKTRLVMAIRATREHGLKVGFQRFFKNKIKTLGWETLYGEFPLNKIRKISLESGDWADSKLLQLIQDADYVDNERFEHISFEPSSNPDNVLTNQEVKLLDHIYNGYEKLNKRLLPKS